MEITVNDISHVIRRYPNDAPAADIAAGIERLYGCDGCAECVTIVEAIIQRVNPDRTMGAGALAEAIHNDLGAN